MRYSLLLLVVFFSLTCIALNRSYAQQVSPKVEEKADHPLAVAIFSRNKSNNASYDKYADMLRQWIGISTV